jgi:2,3-bisphosphoglycerate-dependent phosphoglycerate mutase
LPNFLALLRHGQTKFNGENRFSGAIDLDLTEVGEQQVAMSGKAFRMQGIQFSRVFSSPLIRARKSADIFLRNAEQASLIKKIINSDDLRGRDEGILTGKSRQEAYKDHTQKLVTAWLKSYDQAPPNGETRREMFERRVEPYYRKNVQPALQRGENILISTHHSTIRALFRASGQGILEQSDDLKVENGSLLIFEYSG